MKEIKKKEKSGKRGRLDELFEKHDNKPKDNKGGLQHHEVSRTF